MQNLAEQVTDALSDNLKHGDVNLVYNVNQIELDISSKLLFKRASMSLQDESKNIIKELANVIKKFPNQIIFAVHTDDVPIQGGKYASNWELSAVRATVVVRELIKNGVVAQNLAAVGYSEFKPIATNSTEEGKAKNR